MLPRPGINMRDVLWDLDRMELVAHEHQNDPRRYVDWLHQLEYALRFSFRDFPLAKLYGQRFWQLNAGAVWENTWFETMRLERAAVVEWLSEVRAAAKRMLDFADGDDLLAVLDTHVLLHHKPLREIPWAEVLSDSVGGSKAIAVRLVVPIRVVGEIDDRKSAATKLGDRARTRIRLLERHLSHVEPLPAGVSVTVAASADLDAEADRRPAIPADTETLDTCEALSSYAGANRVVLITGDLAMQIKAQARGIIVRRLPESTFQPLGSSE
jgi:hypothetical protein